MIIYTGLFISQLLQSLVLNYDKSRKMQSLHVDSYINICLASYLDLNYLFCATIHDNHKIHQCVCVCGWRGFYNPKSKIGFYPDAMNLFCVYTPPLPAVYSTQLIDHRHFKCFVYFCFLRVKYKDGHRRCS